MDKDCCFVTSCDSNPNYFKGALTTIKSIRCFSSIPIVFLNAGLNKEQLHELSSQVTEVINISKFLNLSDKIKHAYLNSSALASLYAHYTGYSKIIYLDSDAILLGNIDFIFDLLTQHDVVAVRAGVMNYLESGKIHRVKDEIKKEGIEDAKKILPKLNLEDTAFNTGCFGIKTSILQKWEAFYDDLFLLLPYMIFGDQSVFNLLVSASDINIKEISYKFNLGGSSKSLQEKTPDFKLIIRNGRPIFLYKENQITVPHFSGRPKPWEVDNNSPGKKLWNYFTKGDAILTRLSSEISGYMGLDNRRKSARNASQLDSSWKSLSPVEIRDRILEKARIDNLSDFVEVDYGFGKFLMFSNNDDYVSLRNFWTGGANYEFSSIWLFSYFAECSENIIDAGAYTGVFSLAASVANPKAPIYAFEPIQEIFARLALNTKSNLADNIFPYNYALYHKKSYKRINYFASGEGLLTTGQSLKSKSKQFKATFVPTIQLDKLLDIEFISLIKLDVEDSEIESLKGSRRILKNSEPVIIIECQSSKKLHKILKMFFRDREYLCKFIDDRPCNTNLFFDLESEFWNCKHSRNVLLIPKAKKSMIPLEVH